MSRGSWLGGLSGISGTPTSPINRDSRTSADNLYLWRQSWSREKRYMSPGSRLRGPSGSSGAPTGSINRDSVTSGDNLGVSINDECLEERGLGAFLEVLERRQAR